MSTDSYQDFLSGEVSETTVYKPVDVDIYGVVVVDAEVADPTTFSRRQDNYDQLSADERAKADAPFGRISLKIETDKLGGPTKDVNRVIRQRIDFAPGFDALGRSRLIPLANLIRLKFGLTAKQEVAGFILFETRDLKGLDRADYVQAVAQRFKEAVLGLRFKAKVYHTKGVEVREGINILVPK